MEQDESEYSYSIRDDPVAYVHPETLLVIEANTAFRSEFGETEDVLNRELSKDSILELRAINLGRPAARVTIELKTLGTYEMSSRVCGNLAMICVAFYKICDAVEAAPSPEPEPAPVVTQRAVSPDTTAAAAAAAAIPPPWSASWLSTTSLTLRTNLTAITSMAQLLSTTGLSAEQTLYLQNMR